MWGRCRRGLAADRFYISLPLKMEAAALTTIHEEAAAPAEAPSLLAGTRASAGEASSSGHGARTRRLIGESHTICTCDWPRDALVAAARRGGWECPV